jgi:hypothetical protein
VAEAGDREAKKADTPLPDEPGPDMPQVSDEPPERRINPEKAA